MPVLMKWMLRAWSSLVSWVALPIGLLPTSVAAFPAEELHLATCNDADGVLSVAELVGSVQWNRVRLPNHQMVSKTLPGPSRQVAIDAYGVRYEVSGRDGRIIRHDGGLRTVVFECPGRIHDIVCTGESKVVYVSAVPTSLNGEVQDGGIYRINLRTRRSSLVMAVRQAEVGGQWWGTFTIRDGAFVIATNDSPSRLFKMTAAKPLPIHAKNRFSISGMTTDECGHLLFATGESKLYRTADFTSVESLAELDEPIADVTRRAPPSLKLP